MPKKLNHKKWGGHGSLVGMLMVFIIGNNTCIIMDHVAFHCKGKLDT